MQLPLSLSLVPGSFSRVKRAKTSRFTVGKGYYNKIDRESRALQIEAVKM